MSLRNILQVNLEKLTIVTVEIITVRDGSQRSMENYISLQKSQLLDSLENQVRFSQLVAVLVGEKGIGKSYTLEQLQKRLDDEVCIAHIDASIEIQEDQLHKVICLQLGLPSEQINNAEQSDSVEQFDCVEQSEHIEKSIRTHLRKKALINIDNAHHLSNESLDSLLQLNQSQINHQESVLFLLLAGDESLPKKISFTNTFKNHQEMCVVFQLEAIEKSEVGSLVAAISHLSLDEVEETYGAKQLEYFWQLSKGIPAELEYQVSRWKSEMPEEPINTDETAKENTSYWRGIIYLILGIIFVSILFYQEEINQIIMPDNKANGGLVNTGEIRLDSGNKSKKTMTKGIINTESINKIPDSEGHTNKGKIDKDKESESRDVSTTENIMTSNASTDEKERFTKEPTKDEQTKKTNPATNIQSSTEIKEKNELEKAPVIEKTKTKSKIIKIESGNEERSKSSLSKDEQFLLEQPGAYLTLQWVGVSQLENAQAFRSNHPLKAKMYIYKRKQPSGSYLYLVISDLFSQRSEASVAREKYQKLNYQGTPWIKSLSAIQNEIKN